MLDLGAAGSGIPRCVIGRNQTGIGRTTGVVTQRKPVVVGEDGYLTVPMLVQRHCAPAAATGGLRQRGEQPHYDERPGQKPATSLFKAIVMAASHAWLAPYDPAHHDR